MDAWIEFARGPLFRFCLVFCVAGVALRVGSTLINLGTSWRRAADRELPLADIARATLNWLFPRRLLRVRPVYSALSFAFHAGLLLVVLFLAGHVALWQETLRIPWPTLGPLAADVLTVMAAGALAGLVIGRLASPVARTLSSFGDVAVLVLLFFLMASGFFAAHAALSPAAARAMLLAHILLGNLTLVLTPVTKIVHCVLVPFTQLVGELGWRFPAESGRHVAVVLGKENEPV